MVFNLPIHNYLLSCLIFHNFYNSYNLIYTSIDIIKKTI